MNEEAKLPDTLFHTAQRNGTSLCDIIYRNVREALEVLKVHSEPLFEGDEDLVEVLGTSVVDRVLDFQQ